MSRLGVDSVVQDFRIEKFLGKGSYGCAEGQYEPAACPRSHFHPPTYIYLDQHVNVWQQFGFAMALVCNGRVCFSAARVR